MNPSLYIHIPFCRRKCIYCDFYSALYSDKTAAAYVDALISRLEAVAAPVPTVFIGGGTPTVLEPRLLSRLLAALQPHIRSADEVTVEANPESLTEERLLILREGGVNRLSIGVQSFRDRKLKVLGRVHNARQAEEAVTLAAKRGFANIGMDLIFGVWNETIDDWRKDLDRAIGLPVTHLSCYGLTYEKGTPLSRAVGARSVKPLTDEAVAAMYTYTMERVPAQGFRQYEVSNFAKEGYECRHNLRYWSNDPCIGLGASAVSYIDGVRAKNAPDIAAYIKSCQSGSDPIVSREKLSPQKSARETAALKIRTREGIDFAWFREKTGFDLEKIAVAAISRLILDGLIKYTKDGTRPTGIRLRQRGFLFADTASSVFL